MNNLPVNGTCRPLGALNHVPPRITAEFLLKRTYAKHRLCMMLAISHNAHCVCVSFIDIYQLILIN